MRDIGCNRKAIALNRERLGRQSVEAACEQAEREEFRRHFTAALIEAACVVEKCALSEEEVASFRSPVLNDEAALRRMGAEARRIPEAVRRVYRGEALEAVYDESLKPLNVSLQAFRNEVEMYGSLERVERYLAHDFVETTRRQLEQRARRQAMRNALRRIIESRAIAGHLTIETAADEYLELLRSRLDLRVFDDRFAIPKGREVFR